MFAWCLLKKDGLMITAGLDNQKFALCSVYKIHGRKVQV